MSFHEDSRQWSGYEALWLLHTRKRTLTDLSERRNFDSTIVTTIVKVLDWFLSRTANNSNWYDTITTYLKTVFPAPPMSKYLSHPSAKHAGCFSELLWKLYDEVERIWHSSLSSAAPSRGCRTSMVNIRNLSIIPFQSLANGEIGKFRKISQSLAPLQWD